MSDSRRQLDRLCDHFRTRLKLLLARAGVSRVLALALLLFGAIALIDWRLHLESPWRWLALTGFIAALAVTAWATLLRPLAARWTNRDVLAYLDHTVPETDGMLLDLYELSGDRAGIQEVDTARGGELAAAAMADVEPKLRSLNLRAAFDSGSAGRWTMLAGMLALLVVGVGVLAPAYLSIGAQRLFNPLSSARWPHRTTIVVERPPTGWTVPQLEPFVIHASVTGEVPSRVTLAYRTGESGGWIREKLEVRETTASTNHEDAGRQHGLTYTFPEVRQPVDFYLEGGDYRTDRQRIEVIHRPYVTAINVQYQYPEYAGVPDRTISSGQIAGLEGTKVRLEVECSMPLDRAVFVWSPDAAAEDAPTVSKPDEETAAADQAAGSAALPEDAQRVELTAASDTKFHTSFMLEENGRYAIELYEKNGYREARPEIYEVRVTPDDPPEVALISPSSDLVETNQASVEVAFTASDKLGLSKVEFVYQVDDQPPQVLTDRITGPLAQTGTATSARFTWEMRKMELPLSGNLSYFVRVADNNPTGRGVVESQQGQIRLVKPSEFHLEAIERAKLLEEEARIAWRNQLHAWQATGAWLQQGTGAEDDPTWQQLVDAQQKSLLAARQIRFHLETLTQKYERNHMGQDFMANRLSVVTELLAHLLDQEHPPIVAGLEKSRPRTAADATPDRVKSLRGAAANEFVSHQKMGVLILERMLRKLYDWRDLQNCTVSTKLLYEQQEEVLDRAKEIAPKTIAREIEDLSDKDQETLLTLGKQQRAIFDTETGLERQLTYLTYKAEQQGRPTIRVPLEAAWANLRGKRVNDYLKRAAEMIENNQPSQILDDQAAAMRALEVVKNGLVLAGQKLDSDPPLLASATPADEATFDPDQIKPTDVAANDKPADPSQPATSEDPGPVEIEVSVLPEGSDAVSVAIRLTIEQQDNVLARLRYLAANSTDKEMPRFVRLKQARILELQQKSLQACDVALEQTVKHEQPQAGEILTQVREEMSQSQRLVEAGLFGPLVQQHQADAIDTLKGLLQQLALAKDVEDATGENRRLGGEDAFGRKYLLRESDLDAAVAMLSDLRHAQGQLADVSRKLARFVAHPPQEKLAVEIEVLSRQQAVASQRQLAERVTKAASLAPSLTAEALAEVQKTGAPAIAELALAGYADGIADAKSDESLAEMLKAAHQQTAATVQALRDLLEERVRPPAEVVVTEQAPKISPEEFAKLTSQEHLSEMLKDEESLPPELRELMVRSLAREFPPKYRQLLAAYYASFIRGKVAENRVDQDAPADPPESEE